MTTDSHKHGLVCAFWSAAPHVIEDTHAASPPPICLSRASMLVPPTGFRHDARQSCCCAGPPDIHVCSDARCAATGLASALYASVGDDQASGTADTIRP